MTEYKACPASWDQVKKWDEIGSESSSCLLELLSRLETLEAGLTTVSLDLRDRVGALEAAAKPAEEPDDSVVERVADAIYRNGTIRVIHVIADWLDQQELHVAAKRLRMEVGG